MHKYIHTYIHAYIPTYIHAYRHSCTQTAQPRPSEYPGHGLIA